VVDSTPMSSAGPAGAAVLESYDFGLGAPLRRARPATRPVNGQSRRSHPRAIPPSGRWRCSRDAAAALWQGRTKDDGCNGPGLDAPDLAKGRVLRRIRQVPAEGGITFSQRTSEAGCSPSSAVTRLLLLFLRVQVTNSAGQGRVRAGRGHRRRTPRALDEVDDIRPRHDLAQ